jgi:Flp pilus assembly pilin Flp
MSTFTRSLRHFVHAEDGASTVEYGILIVIVAGITIFVLSQMNEVLQKLYGKFGSSVNSGT